MKTTLRLSLITATAALMLALPTYAQKNKAPKTTAFDAPSVACLSSTPSAITLKVTAGASGAPAGFSVQYMLASDLAAAGGVWPSDESTSGSFCKASFSGNASGYSYSLSPGESVEVTLGDVIFDTPGASSGCENTPLNCGQNYVFRSFAHATSTIFKSAWSATTTCSTARCSGGGGCTYTQGYWKTHGPIPTGNNVNVWPVTSLSLGTVSYTDFQLLSILNTPGAGNGLLTLAHQLIAAKLNVASGADGSAVAGDIAAADGLIGGLVSPPIGSGSLSNGLVSGLNGTLTSFNEGAIGPGHCQ